MSFIPYEYTLMAPSIADPIGESQAAPGPKTRNSSIILPFPLELNPADITQPTVTLVAGTLYAKDFFLFHPQDQSFQRMWLSTFDTYNFDSFLAVQLIEQIGQTVTELQQEFVIKKLGVDPTFIDQARSWSTGAVFLRLIAAASGAPATLPNVSIFFTLHSLTTEVY